MAGLSSRADTIRPAGVRLGLGWPCSAKNCRCGGFIRLLTSAVMASTFRSMSINALSLDVI